MKEEVCIFENYNEPYSKGIDYYIYKYCVIPISRKMCFIHPIIITILSFLMYIPIVYNIIYNKSYIVLVLLVIISALLDSLDGSIARSCNKQSKAGAILDSLTDSLGFLIVLIIVLVKVIKSDNIGRGIRGLYIFLGIVLGYMIIHGAVYEIISKSKYNNSMFEHNKVLQFYHDNLPLFIILIHVLLKWVYNSV